MNPLRANAWGEPRPRYSHSESTSSASAKRVSVMAVSLVPRFPLTMFPSVLRKIPSCAASATISIPRNLQIKFSRVMKSPPIAIDSSSAGFPSGFAIQPMVVT